MIKKSILALLTVLIIPSIIFAGYSSVDTLRLADQGSASAPSLTRKGDTNTGLYFSAADTLDVTAGGSRVLTFSSSGISNLGDQTWTSSTASEPSLQVINTNADANSASFDLLKNSASPADNDDVLKIRGIGYDSQAPTTLNATTYGQILIESEDVTEATEDGSLDLQVMKAGTLTSALLLTGGTVTIDAPTGNATLTTGNINISVVIGGTTYYIKANTSQ